MKLIKIPISAAVQGLTGAITLKEALDLHKLARQNKDKILNGALFLESWLDDIIAEYFFHDDPQRRNIFNSSIGYTDWFTFGNKIKVFRTITNEIPNLESADRKSIIDDLRKVMEYRNAFAHGEIVIKGEEVYLSYFRDNRLKELLLSDHLLDEIEKLFCGTYSKFKNLSTNLTASDSDEDASEE